MKRLIVFSVLFILLVPRICFSERAAGKAEKNVSSIPIELTFSWRTSPSFYNAKGFPLEIRSVPLHEDDDWLKGNKYSEEPLPDTLLSMNRSQAFEVSLFYTPKLFGIGLIVSLHQGGGKGSRYRQNQNGNSNRALGSSLRWYELDTKALSQVRLAGFTATPWLKVFPEKYLRLKTGGIYDLTGTRIICSSGWDRWGSDEQWKDLKLAKLYESMVFIALEVGFLLNEIPGRNEYFYVQIMYYEPFYTLIMLEGAPDLRWEQGRDKHWSLGIGLAF